MQIIGINGFKRSGKGAVGNAIDAVTESHRPFLVTKQVGFADKLKIIAARSLGFTERTDEECVALMDSFKVDSRFSILYDEPDHPDESDYCLHELNGRQYLQWMGNEARNVFEDTFWIDQVLPPEGLTSQGIQYALKAMYPETDVLAITDLRYENEAMRVLNLGGEVWRIHRPEAESDGHASEQVLPDVCVTREIDNDGTLDELHWTVERILENMGLIEPW